MSYLLGIGDLTTGIIGATALFITFSVFIILFLLMAQKKKHQHNLKMIEMSMKARQMEEQFQQEILQAQLEIQEQTLKNISQEIHDNIGQALSLAKLNLNMMDPASPSELQEKILNSKNLVSKAIQDLRDLSRTMNTDNISALGFTRALEMELDMMKKSGFKSSFTIEGNIRKMEARRELILFRIVQETLNNVIKHAQAESISIIARYSQDRLLLTVSDNGKGFVREQIPAAGDKTAGMGLNNMESRARIIGADFTIRSRPGSGTTIIIDIPFTNSVKP